MHQHNPEMASLFASQIPSCLLMSHSRSKTTSTPTLHQGRQREGDSCQHHYIQGFNHSETQGVSLTVCCTWDADIKSCNYTQICLCFWCWKHIDVSFNAQEQAQAYTVVPVILLQQHTLASQLLSLWDLPVAFIMGFSCFPTVSMALFHVKSCSYAQQCCDSDEGNTSEVSFNALLCKQEWVRTITNIHNYACDSAARTHSCQPLIFTMSVACAPTTSLLAYHPIGSFWVKKGE